VAGSSGADDPLEQARAAQIPAHARMAPWFRYAVAPGLGLPPPPPMAATAPPAAHVQASPGDGPAQAGSNGTAAAGGAEPGTGPKPVPPTLTPAEREAGRIKGLRLKAERKAICQQLCTGQMTLAEVLARNDQTAGGMRVVAALKAMAGIGGATAARLLRETGIDGRNLIRGLTARQRARLAAAAAVTADSLPPGNAETTPPENTGDDWGQIIRDRDLGVGDAVKAALLEQAGLEKPLTHRAIARRLGVSHVTVSTYCAELMDSGFHYAECPHRFTESGREAPGRKPAAHASPRPPPHDYGKWFTAGASR